jgi:hypothetical protein
MKILIFLHGTIIMHKNAKGKSREERVKQSMRRERSVLNYDSYIPIGNAARKLKKWGAEGAKIIYLSSHKNAEDVKKDKAVLKKYKFPVGKIVFRNKREKYKNVIERTAPDILIEDDCESIGGKKEMAITNVKKEIKNKIKSIVVKEFEGIDSLPDKI